VRLYHGTTEAVARQALATGLLPRSLSQVETRWEDCPSNPDLVYLTTAYAPYFAMSATEPGERWGVLEVDTELLDEYSLLPDEDFLEQASRGQDIDEDLQHVQGMHERTAWFRTHIREFGHLWRESLEGLGNCAHQGVIPPEAITRVSLFDSPTNQTMAMLAMDPPITLTNFRFCEGKYRALTRWIMGEDVDPACFLGVPGLESSEDLEGPWLQLLGQWDKALSLRQGLEIIRQR